MSDLVERKVVLRCIKESAEDIDWGQSEDGDAFKHYVAAVYRTVAYPGCVPSAQPTIEERKHGNWVGIDDEPHDEWECDRCGFIYDGSPPSNFCENCGADMRGEQE